MTKENPVQRYDKGKLSDYYTKGQAQKDILKVLPDVLRDL